MAIYYGDGSNSGAGRVIQVVFSSYNGNQVVGAGSGAYHNYNNNLSCFITPKSTGSRILIMAHVCFMTYPSRDSQGIVLYKDGSILDAARGVSDGSRMRFWGSCWLYDGDNMQTITANYVDSPSSTSQIRYTVGMGADSGSNNTAMNRTWNYGNAQYDARGVSTLTCMEIAS